MNVFVSWSGVRSHHLAETLRSWLPRVLQRVRPWMSEKDISAGSRWLTEVSNELSQAKVGIICVTPENQANPWLVFEAGALSKTIDETYVCPVLFDLSPSQLSGPLAQFQANAVDRNGIGRMLNSLNKALDDAQLPEDTLAEIQEVWWPKFETRIQEMPPAPEANPQRRSLEDILEEIVANTREQIRRENIRLEASRQMDARANGLLNLLHSCMPSFQQGPDRPKAIAGAAAGGLDAKDVARLAGNMDAPEIRQLMALLNEMQAGRERMTENLIESHQEDHAANEEASHENPSSSRE
jgi:hypothetical protein